MPFDVGYLRFYGEVVRGMGEGSEYLSMDEYRRKFKKEVEIDPSYGTLNLKLNDENYRRLQDLRLREGIEIDGFVKDDQYYGGATVFPAEVEGVKCAVVLPEITDHERVLELISNHHLRKELELEDRDHLYVKVWVNLKKSWLDVEE